MVQSKRNTRRDEEGSDAEAPLPQRRGGAKQQRRATNINQPNALSSDGTSGSTRTRDRIDKRVKPSQRDPSPTEDDEYISSDKQDGYTTNEEEEAQMTLSPNRGRAIAKVSQPTIMRSKYNTSSDTCFSSSPPPRRLPNVPSSLGESGLSRPSTMVQFPHHPTSSRDNAYLTPSSAESGFTDRESQVYKRGKRRRRESPDRTPLSDSDRYNHSRLFGKAKRREQFASSEGHIEMVKACKGLMVARVLSGDGTTGKRKGRRCDAWANANPEFEGSLVQQVWDEVYENRTTFQIASSVHVQSSPYPVEARKIRDYVSDYRSKVMQRAREEVRWLFPIDDPMATTKDKVQFLLDHDRFMCGPGTTSGDEADITDRWTSAGLVRLINRVFWIKADSGLARHSGTRKYFDPLRPETIYYIVTYLYTRFKSLWEQQSQLKQQMICQILTQRVKLFAAGMDGEQSQEVCEDPYKDDLRVLESYKAFLPQHLREKLTEEISYTHVDEQQYQEDQPVIDPTINGQSIDEVVRKDVQEYTFHWHVGEAIYQVQCDWNSSFTTLMEQVHNSGRSTRSRTQLKREQLLMWVYLEGSDNGKESMISDDEEYQRVLDKMRRSGYTTLHGRPWQKEDEQSE